MYKSKALESSMFYKSIIDAMGYRIIELAKHRKSHFGHVARTLSHEFSSLTNGFIDSHVTLIDEAYKLSLSKVIEQFEIETVHSLYEDMNVIFELHKEQLRDKLTLIAGFDASKILSAYRASQIRSRRSSAMDGAIKFSIPDAMGRKVKSEEVVYRELLSAMTSMHNELVFLVATNSGVTEFSVNNPDAEYNEMTIPVINDNYLDTIEAAGRYFHSRSGSLLEPLK